MMKLILPSNPISPLFYPEKYIQTMPINFSNMAEGSIRSHDDENSTDESGSCTPRKRPAEAMDFKIKYKTEICRYWMERGVCQYGTNCAFAHGYHEIREKSHLPNNYKTRKCKRYHTKGYCSYGFRCQFQHQKRKKENRKSKLYMTYNKYFNNMQKYFDDDSLQFMGLCPKSKIGERLSFFKSIPEDHNPLIVEDIFKKDLGVFDEKKINRFVDQLLRDEDLGETL